MLGCICSVCHRECAWYRWKPRHGRPGSDCWWATEFSPVRWVTSRAVSTCAEPWKRCCTGTWPTRDRWLLCPDRSFRFDSRTPQRDRGCVGMERIARAPKLKLAVTAGIGSDHVDLDAAIEHGVTVAEVTYCNSISVAEHVVMMILSQVRNYLPSYEVVLDGGWNIADCVARSYD